MHKEDDQGSRPLCLILDGNPVDLANLEFAASYGGLAVAAVSTEVDALVTLSDFTVDIVVVSPDLQGSGSVGFVRRLRSSSDMPVVVISERLDRTFIVQCLEAGADDVLSKPFFIDEFAARLDAVLRRTGRRSNSSKLSRPVPAEPELAAALAVSTTLSLRDRPLQVRQFGSIRMDPFEKCAAIKDRVIGLTDGEYIVLEALAAKRGAVATREEIDFALYGLTGRRKEKVLDVLISRVKKKLRDALGPTERMLLNHRGRGWSLHVE